MGVCAQGQGHIPISNPLNVSRSRLLARVAGGQRRSAFDPRAELISLSLLLLFLIVAQNGELGLEPAVEFVVGPGLLLTIMIGGGLQLLRAEPASIWTPMLWFRVSCAVYFGIGAMAPFICNEATLIEMQSFYFFSEHEVQKVNILNVLSILVVLFAAQFVVVGAAPQPRRTARPHSPSVMPFTIAFLGIGGFARYGIVVPFLLGYGDGILPSIVAMLATAYSAGLMLLTYISLGSRRYLLPVAVALVLTELFVGVLLFSKSDVLVTIMFLILAVYHRRPSLFCLAGGAAAAVAVFMTLAPIIGYGRVKTIELGGGQQIASIEERWHILQRYLEGDRLKSQDIDVQSSLSRISYVNAATLVVALYDQGRSLGTLSTFFAVFVPRFLWPEKPDITESGRSLYLMATDQEGTSVSSGLFAEAYYNYGWWGAPLMMVPIGIVLGLLSRMAIRVMRQERWIYLPVVLMGLHVGTRVDGHFIPDMLGAPLTAAIVFGITRFAEVILTRRRKHTTLL